MLYSDCHSRPLAIKTYGASLCICMSGAFDSLLGCLQVYDHNDVTVATSITDTIPYLEKISNQAIVSHLENGSLWVLVDGNNSLNLKKKKKHV